MKLDDSTAAREELAALEAASRRGYVDAAGLAGIYASLGDTTRALDLLDQAYRDKAFTLPFVRVMPPFEPTFAPRAAMIQRAPPQTPPPMQTDPPGASRARAAPRPRHDPESTCAAR